MLVEIRQQTTIVATVANSRAHSHPISLESRRDAQGLNVCAI